MLRRVLQENSEFDKFWGRKSQLIQSLSTECAEISVINNPKPRFVTAISKLPPDVTDFLAPKSSTKCTKLKEFKTWKVSKWKLV